MRPPDLQPAPAQDQDLVLVLVLDLVAMVVAEGLLQPRQGRSATKHMALLLRRVSCHPAPEDRCRMGRHLTNSHIRCLLPTLENIQKQARANSLTWMKEDDDLVVGGAGLAMYIFSILDIVNLSLAGL